jgi:hypothetical protein
MDNPFDAYRKRTRRNAIVGVVVASCALAAAIGTYVFFAGRVERLLQSEKPALESVRARYCKIYEETTRTDAPKAVGGVGEPLLGIGWYSFDRADLDRVEPGGNLDTIDRKSLEGMCTPGAAYEAGDVFHSAVAELSDPNERTRNSWSHAAIKHAVDAVKRIRFVLLLRLKDFVPSVSTGGSTMRPGRYSGVAEIRRLEDGALLATVSIEGKAPSVATVYTLSRHGPGHETDVNMGLSVNTSIAMKDEIVAAFKAQSIDLKL